MKKLVSVLALVLVATLMLTMLVGCGDEPTPDPAPNPDDGKVTVTWYDGTKELKTEKVDKGSKVTSWEPTKDGYSFDGWYSEASVTVAFDFNTAINEDTDIFAKFKSDEFVADTNSYYLVGTGSGDMQASNWDQTNANNVLNMEKQEVAGKNVYTITILMYAGDQFQICYGGTWDGQTGIGRIAGAEYVDGVHTDGNTYTAADKKVAEVKDAEGNVVFVGYEEYGKSYEVWNIKLADGMDGRYEFTFTTYPNAKDYNEITYKLVEKVDPLTTTHDMHIAGSVNGWDTTNALDEWKMKKSDDGKTWSIIFTAEAGAEFKVRNHIGNAWYGDGDANFVVAEAGTYAVRYTVETNAVEVEKCAYYVIGTFVDGEGNTVNFAVKAGVTPALTVTDGVASGTVTIVDTKAQYDWMVDQAKPGDMAIKVVFGSELAIRDWHSDDANGGDNWYLYAGQYTVSLDIASGAVTITPVE